MRSTKLPSWTERLLGLDPIAAPPHVFTLTRGELAYGSFHRSDGGYVFEAVAATPLDPETFTDRITAVVPMTKVAGELYEYACHEGNYALTNILAGARAED